MRKGIKILGKVLSWIVITIVGLPIIVALLLNIGAVQNFAVSKAAEYLSRKLETTVSIDHIRLRGFSQLTAQGLYVEDYQGDTLLYAGRLRADISKSALLRKKVVISNVLLEKAKIYLYTPTEGQLNIAQLIDKFGSDSTKTQNNSMRLDFRDLQIENSRFKFQREGADTLSNGLNFGNMVFNEFNLSAPSLTIQGGAIDLDIQSLSFRDISGFIIEDMSTPRLTVDNGTISLEDARIETRRSDLHIPMLSMKGETWKSLGNITDSVRFDVNIANSTLSTRTLAYFIHALPQSDGIGLRNLNLTFGGTINNFNTRLSLTAGYDEAELALNASVKDITDIRKAVFDLRIASLETSGTGLRIIANQFVADSLPAKTADILSRAGQISLTAEVSGEAENFTAEMNMTADAGTLALTGKGGMPASGGIDFNGRLRVNGLNAGTLLGNELLGKVSIDAKASGRAGNGSVAVNGSIFVPSAEFNGYTYTQIGAAGSYNNKKIVANLNSADPKLLLSVNGSADLGSPVPEYNATVNLRRIDLHSLHVNQKDSVALLSGDIKAVGSGSELDNLNGLVTITDLHYVSSTDDVRADTILLTARNTLQSKYLAFNSSFADLEFRSGISYKEILGYLNHILYDYLPALDPTGEALANHHPVTYAGIAADTLSPTRLSATGLGKESSRKPYSPPSYEEAENISELHLNIKKANNIAAIILPGFSIAEGTKADAVFDTRTETFNVTANSDYIEYSKFFVTRLGFRADNTSEPGAATLKFTTEDLYLPGFSMPSNDISARIADDKIDLRARISNSTTELNASLDIESILSRSPDNSRLRIGVLFNPSSYVMAGGQKWEVSSDMIEYDPGKVAINHFIIKNGSQSLTADGTLSAAKTDTLQLDLHRFDLSPLNSLQGMKDATVGGILDGGAALISGMKDPVLIADIRMDSLRVNNWVSAPLRLRSTWDFATERAGLSLQDVTTGKNIVTGFYRPDTNAYYATIDIDGIPLAVANPFLPKDIIRSVEGNTAVYLEVSGSKGLPKMNGTVSITDFAATIGITNVTYSTKTLDIDIDGSVINLPKTVLTDNEGNKATLSAEANIANTANITYEAHLVPSNIMAINTGIRDNEQFYGKVYISGAVNVRGSRNGIDVDVAITTQPNSAFYLSLANKSSVSEVDWITFKSRIPDEYSTESVLEHKRHMYEESLKELSRKSEKVNMNLNVSLNINPGLLLSIIVDPTNNMVLNSRGSASLDVMLNPGTGELSTFGTYEISEGDFLFSLQPVISTRKFILQRGSTIQMSGNPMDALLNIEAIYRVRASLQPLEATLQGTGLTTNTRIPVDCIVRVSESLAHPDITFDIRIPSADADIQNVLSGALASNEDRALNFLWLVGFGSFAPDGTSNTENSAASTGAAMGLDFLTNQITNAFSTEDLNIMLRYRPQQDKATSDELDFGFSYNIGGNDRLILEVEGNYNTQNNSPNTANLTGDASITWVITPSGNLSLKAFTRTINRYNEYQGLQENGVGIYYKEDFNVFSDIITQQRQRREARRRRRAEKAAAKAAQAAGVELPSAEEAPDGSSTDLPATGSDGAIPPAKSRIEQRRQESEEQRRRMFEERRRDREAQVAGDESSNGQNEVRNDKASKDKPEL